MEVRGHRILTEALGKLNREGSLSLSGAGKLGMGTGNTFDIDIARGSGEIVNSRKIRITVVTGSHR